MHHRLCVAALLLAISVSAHAALRPSAVWYVSPAGSDANTGLLPASPFLTIQRAVDAAFGKDGAEIRLAEGVYLPGAGLLDGPESGARITGAGLTLSGGWDARFASSNGVSRLDGKGKLIHVVAVSNADRLVLENLVIAGGRAEGKSTNDQCGGGIHAVRMERSMLTRIRIEDCRADYLGGGLFLESGDGNAVRADFVSNGATFGGGADFRYTAGLLLEGNFIGNTNAYDGGGLYLYKCSNAIVDARFRGNVTRWTGGGMAMFKCHGVRVRGAFTGNSGENGGGLYLDMCVQCGIDVKMSENSAKMSGGGMSMEGGDSNNVKGAFSCNRAGNGGAIHVRWPGMHTIDATVVSNTANFRGGGLLAEKARGLSVGGTFSCNSAGLQGGGLCFTASASNRIDSLLLSNIADNGGGLFIQSGTNDLVRVLCEANHGGKGGSAVALLGGTGETFAHCDYRENIGTNGQLRVNSGPGMKELRVLSNTFIAAQGEKTPAFTMDGAGPVTGFVFIGNRFGNYGDGILFRNREGKEIRESEVSALNAGGDAILGAAEARGNSAH